MAVYYKFKSAKDYQSLLVSGNFISVRSLKQKIFESENLGSGTDIDILISNASTNEEYADEATLIPRSTSLIVRRVPGWPRMPIVIENDKPKASENKVDDIPKAETSQSVADSSTITFPGHSELNEFDFGNYIYASPKVVPVQSGDPVQVACVPDGTDEDSRIKALDNTSSLDCQHVSQEAVGSGRGFGRGRFGRLECKTPPQGYICHRCKIPGHFIQHCPTNGDPNFDIKRLRPPMGTPKSMSMMRPDGSHALPSGAVVVLKPDEASYEKEIKGLPSARHVPDVPPQLRCTLCKEVMKDAVLIKCCFNSFCDKCIRDRIISKSTCTCGSANILVDDLLPNKTVRETINSILQSATRTSSTVTSGSLVDIQDMKSFCGPQPKVQSPTLFSAVKEECITPFHNNTPIIKESTKGVKAASNVPEKSKAAKNVNQSDATLKSVSGKEVLQAGAPQGEEEIQQELPVGDQGKKNKKKRCLPCNGKFSQEFAAENYMVPCPGYNPFLEGMQTGMDGYTMFYAGYVPSFMGYTPGQFHSLSAGFLPQNPSVVVEHGYMIPGVPQREFYGSMECGREVSSSADISSGLVTHTPSDNKKRKSSS